MAQMEKVKDDPVTTLSKFLVQREKKISTMLAGSIPQQHFVQVAMNLFAGNKKLRECTMQSVLLGIYSAATLGLSLDPSLKESYLVPFKGKATFIIGYKGLENLCIRSGIVDDIYSRVVCEDDHFEWEEGLEPKLIHRPSVKGATGKLIGAYAVATLSNGRKRFKYVPAAEIIAFHMKRSASVRAGVQSPWDTDTPAMYCKTAIRMLASELPRARSDIRLAKALSLEEEQERADLLPGDCPISLEGVDGDSDGRVFEVTAEDVTEDDQPESKPKSVAATVASAVSTRAQAESADDIADGKKK
jgi:recombination protein RecT